MLTNGIVGKRAKLQHSKSGAPACSCDPNLAIYSVYTDTLHPGKPLLALYAIKDIVAGTELAYDYKYGDPGQASPGSTDGQIECRCGAKNCQKWLPDPTGIKSEHQD